jgi:hypothetical protein
MSAERRATAEVPMGCRSSDIRWLVIEYDERSRGWFLFGHRSLEEPSEFDSWHPTRDEALKEAETEWGILRDSWRVEAM